jgi:hypothetical protein
MNPPLNEDPLADATPEQIYSALFAQLVTGHAQIAMMFLGRFPNPQTGKNEEPEPEAAKIYIDQLEMLEAKTRGNLSPDETRLLKEMLSATRLAFVEAIETQITESQVQPSASAPTATAPETPAEGADDKVKFSKKYG